MDLPLTPVGTAVYRKVEHGSNGRCAGPDPAPR
jgi:hypothetical protein